MDQGNGAAGGAEKGLGQWAAFATKSYRVGVHHKADHLNEGFRVKMKRKSLIQFIFLRDYHR
jgi:hypothetical protein